MSAATKIEWTEATWNPVTGCTKVSPGCDHCYAETMHERFHGKGSFATVTLHPDRLTAPLRWRRPRRIFVNSMSDLFHADVPDEYIARVFATMGLAPRHTFQVLTKRHARMRSLLRSDDFERKVGDVWLRHPERVTYTEWPGWPLPNVWLGVSAEDQRWADIRIPALLATPAAVRWVSAEPLLGPIDLDEESAFLIPGFDCPCETSDTAPCSPTLDWVVAGGESGPGARPMHPGWARLLRDRCAEAGTPFLLKQWGAWAPVEPDIWQNRRASDHEVRADGYSWPLMEPHGAEDGTQVLMRRVGKGRAGRLLDGVQHDGYPAPLQGVAA